MQQFIVEHLQVTLYGDLKKALPVICVHCLEGEESVLWEACQVIKMPDFILATITGMDWQDDLSPWQAPALYKKQPGFAGHGATHLEKLQQQVLPAIMTRLGAMPTYVALAGYSLAGLFAMMAVFEETSFSRFVSVSGSLWYPHFVEKMLEKTLEKLPMCVYISLGDAEGDTRHAQMKTIAEATEKLVAHLKACDVPTHFEWNEGGHFQDETERLAKGIRWMLLYDN